jgi:NAD(P)-dependent dehydrogenase (short-subunit alcohol dehydrogenase family)
LTSPGDGCLWITGASSGIGRATALAFARAGWTVAASARSAAALAALAGEPAAGGRIHPVVCDVTDRRSVKAAVEAVEAVHGPIALAILSAGTYEPDGAEGFSADRFRSMVEVNLMGAAECLGALLPLWTGRRRGHLVVIASAAGWRGLPRALAYGATKAALINLCEALWLEFRRLGLTVQLVNPGFVRTPLTDRNTFRMPFLMEADEAAERILRAVAGRRFETTFPRRFTWPMKLLRLLPYGLYFRIVAKVTGR